MIVIQDHTLSHNITPVCPALKPYVDHHDGVEKLLLRGIEIPWSSLQLVTPVPYHTHQEFFLPLLSCQFSNPSAHF